jgi:hypothetical protein
MNSNDQNNNSVKRDPDFVKSEHALRRAANRARELARQKNSYVVVYRDGKIVKEKVDRDVA